MQSDLFASLEPTASGVPASESLATLRAAARTCRECDLYRDATQTVFGEGPAHAPLMLVGEQPGDAEDRSGHPFVGPAGKLLREALVEAGIDAAQTYITNAVKHFKFVERGKRRIHATPKRIEVVSCMPWLVAEIKALRPQLVVALGATAAQALLGAKFRITVSRGTLVSSPLADRVIATAHPSSILRAVDDEARAVQYRAFVDDLRIVAQTLRGLEAASEAR
jgi:DNA polymerase